MPKSENIPSPGAEPGLPIEVGPWDKETEGSSIGLGRLGKIEEERGRAEEEKKRRMENSRKELRALLAVKEGGKDQSYYVMAEKLYGEITGEDLGYGARRAAQAEARKEGARVLEKTQYFKDNMERAQIWARNNEKDEYWEKYFRPRKEHQSMDINNYVREKKWGLESKAGISLQEDTVFEIMRRGFDPAAIKKTGWFFKRIEIPPSTGKGPSLIMSKSEFEKWIKQINKETEERTREAGKEELNRIIGVGEERARERRERHMMEMMRKAAAEEKPEAKPAPAPEIKIPDPKELNMLKKDLKDRFEGGVSFESVINKKTKELESYSQKSKKIEPLSGTEAGLLRELGLLGQGETGKMSAREIAGIGEKLVKKLEAVTKEIKMGHSILKQDSAFLAALKKFTGEKKE